MISVCIATYNGEKYIKEQLDSILCQLEVDDEVIISDDGSTDKTIEIINSYNDNRIKIFHHKRDVNLLSMIAVPFRLSANNFENAMKNASGEYVFLSDQDDIWPLDRIEKMQDYLNRYDLVMCNYNIIDGKENIIIERFWKKNPVSKSLLKNVLTHPFRGCCMSFRREVLDYCLPFPKACIGHDYWIGCLVLLLGNFKYVDEPLHLYRRHEENISFDESKSINPFWFKVLYRMSFIFRIILRSFKTRL